MNVFKKIKEALFDGTGDDACIDDVPCFTIDEVPNLRNTGIFEISCGHHPIASVSVVSDNACIDGACVQITRSIGRVRESDYPEVKFVNISGFARNQFEAHLSSLGRTFEALGRLP